MDEVTKRIEAVLFTLGKFVSLEELAKYCEMGSLGLIKQALEELEKEYANRDTALVLQEMDGKFKLNIKKEYGYLTNKLVSGTEFDASTTKTLAVIAYKAPVLQAEIIKIRGNKAYDHIKLLKEALLVTADPKGHSYILKLTPQFYEYFDTIEDAVKQQFEHIQLLEEVKKKELGISPEEPSSQASSEVSQEEHKREVLVSS